MADTKYLELHRGKYRVVVDVPRRLHSTLGTKLKRALGTDSLAQANRLKHGVVAELKRLIDRASNGTLGDGTVSEALELRRLIDAAGTEEAVKSLQLAADIRADDLRGEPVGEEEDPRKGPLPVFDVDRERRAGVFYKIAHGLATPLRAEHEKFIDQSVTKKRTKGDDRRAMEALERWCDTKGVQPLIEVITPKVAVRFVDDLPELLAGRTAVTLNKYVSRLRAYWAWLERRHVVEVNPWSRRKLAVPVVPHDAKPREFTDAEVKRLLEGPATPAMFDLMMIGALTGARLDTIVDLKVKDCVRNRFVFKPQKKEPAPREVPIHTALRAIVNRRMKGRAEGDDLFPEYPRPVSNSERERSFKASNHFTDYRRSVGVDDTVAGQRRSRVTFHSFRRWFITRAERADQPRDLIALIVGHKREGETFGTYSAGALFEQKRRCVEAVRLPALRGPRAAQKHPPEHP